jgi:hypothetical protein
LIATTIGTFAGHDQDDDVGHLGAAGAHQRECFVTRGVEKHDAAAVAHVDVVGADVLGDAAGLALGDLRLPDRVEQRRLAMVDVTHDRHDRGARSDVFWLRLVAFGRHELLFEAPHLDLGTELARDVLGRVHVHRAVDGHHHATHQQLGQDVLHADVELVSQVLDGHALGQRDDPRDRRRGTRCRRHRWRRRPFAPRP